MALVEGIQRILMHHSDFFLYSDSKIALRWLQIGCCNSQLRSLEPDLPIRELVQNAEAWLARHSVDFSRILKWNTAAWGEIPADFGRK